VSVANKLLRRSRGVQKRAVATTIPEKHIVPVGVVSGGEKVVSVGKGSSKTAVTSPSSSVVPKVFGKSEIGRLYDAARKFLDNMTGINRWSPFERLVRCKPSDYFDNLKGERMIPYLKDQNGHAASAINGRMKGLFFAINTSPVTSSPFGEVKFEIDAHELLNRAIHKVYFADFYCNSTTTTTARSDTGSLVLPHYVTLVVCKKGSKSDKFCEKNGLLEVDTTKPDSIVRVQRGLSVTPSYSVIGKNPEVHVEVFYTEPVELSRGSLFKKIPVIGKGQSTEAGIKRIPNCQHCDFF